MKLSKLGVLYVSVGAVVAAVACSGEEASDVDRSAPAAVRSESSSTVVVEKALDGGVTTSDAAP